MPLDNPGAPADLHLSPSLDEAKRFIELLTGALDTPMYFRCVHDSDRTKPPGMWGTPQSVAEAWPLILAAQKKGYGVFAIPNEGGNSDDDITRVRALFIDGDGIPLPEEWEWHVKPSFIVMRNAAHWHAYWLVTDCEPDDFRTAQRRLVAHYGSDRAVINPSRIMRLAGSLHLKNPDHPTSVRIYR